MAASTYTQLLVVTQQTEARKKMMDYAFNLRDETISLGKAAGKAEAEIMPSEAEIKSHIEKSVSNAGSDDEPKLMPSPFLETEIAHCKLNDQLR